MPAKMSLERIAKALTEALNADETTMHLALQTLQLGYTLGQQDSQKAGGGGENMDFDSPWDFVWLAQMAALIVAVMAMLVACAAALAR